MGIWSVISSSWFAAWCRYSGFERPLGSHVAAFEPIIRSDDRPGEIDNQTLQEAEDNHLQLSTQICENIHYVLVCKEVSDKLFQWYGGGPQFNRSVVAVGLQGEPRVELYPIWVTVVECDPLGGDENKQTRKVIPLSRQSTLQHLRAKISRMRSMEARRWYHTKRTRVMVRLWRKELMEEDWLLVNDEDLNIPLGDLGLSPSMLIMMELTNPDGTFPRKTTEGQKLWDQFAVGDTIDCLDTVSKWYESTVRAVKDHNILVHFDGWARNWDEWIDRDSDRLAPRGSHTDGPRQKTSSMVASNKLGSPVRPGCVGLTNLGNTCFMNSILQCLSNTPAMAQVFLTDRYQRMINRENPLGWQGRVAEAFAKLLKEIWSGSFTVVAPVQFKQVIGEFAPQFSGFQQQDSSEFLSFLLDGLHEDLNQIKVKPATQMIESDGTEDEAVIAQRSWDIHLLRNNSVIVNTMQGQLKSRLVCPTCTRVSVTFDPFLFLTLPLPQGNQSIIKVMVVFADSTRHPTHYAVKLSRWCNVESLMKRVSELCGISDESMVLADIWDGRVQRFYRSSVPLADICNDDELVAYEVGQKQAIIQVSSKLLVEASTFGHANSPQHKWQSFGVPRIICLPFGSVTTKSIAERIIDMFSHLPLRSGDNESVEGSSSNQRIQSSSVHDYIGTSKLSIGMPAYRFDHHADINTDADDDDTVFAEDTDSETETLGMRHSDLRKPTSLKFGLKGGGALSLDNEETRTPPLLNLAASQPDTDDQGHGLSFKISGTGRLSQSCIYCNRKSCDGCELQLKKEIDITKTTTRTMSLAVHWTGTPRSLNMLKQELDSTDFHESTEKCKAADKGDVTLLQCLKEFGKTERLHENEQWYCRVCREFCCATKEIQLWKLPEVLIISLKRFSYTRLWREKMTTFVEFPFTGLTFESICANPEHRNAAYDLYAVSNHMGSMGSGHYTGYAKNPTDQKWYLFDDSVVTGPVEEKVVKSKSAYVLFYRRRSSGSQAYRNA